MNAILDKNNITTQAGDITVYNYDGITREYISSSVEYLAVGVGIPANSAVDEPPAKKKGKAICRNAAGAGWEYVADHRGETVYNTDTGEPVEITAPGDYPAGTTTLAPSTPYDKWDGSAWVTDADAQQATDEAEAQAEKQRRIDETNDYINGQQWPSKLALGRLSEDETAQFNEWLDYLDAVSAVDASTAPDIEWPTPPEQPAS